MSEPFMPKGIKAGVSGSTPFVADTRGLEGKLIRLLENSMDRQSFDTRAFGYLISLLPSTIQAVFMQSVLDYLSNMTHKLGTDTYADNTEYELCIMAMRIREALDQY